MKFLRLLLASAAMLVFMSISHVATAQVTVGSGTTNNSNAPITSCYGYSYTEQIYLQSEIGTSGNITTVSFYVNSVPSSTSNSEDWTIYMGHTSQSDYATNTDWIDANNMTQVFTGNVPLSVGWVTVTLTTPFAYNNTDNLVIGVDENMAGWNCTVQWANTNAGANRTIYYRSDSNNPDPLSPPSATNRQTNRPNVQLGGITQACPAPSGLGVSSLTATSADLDWTENGTATTWNVEWGAAGFTQGSGTVVTGTTTNPYSLSSLTSNTAYEFYVQADCGGQGTSVWVGPFSFTTLCGAYTPPYLEDFAGGVPPNACWDEAGNGTPWNGGPTSLGFGNWATDGFANQGGTGAAKINLYNTGDNEWLLSPDYDLTTGGPYQVQYDFAIYNWNSSTTVGSLGSDDTVQVLISIDAGATWSSLMVHDAAYTAVAGGDNEVIDLTAYSGNTVRFAIWASEGAVDDPEDVDVFVDNFWVRTIPNCLDPSALTANNITATDATFDWTPGGTETSWNVEYGLPGFTVNVDPVGVATASTDSLDVTGLMPATTYEYYVQADCGGGVTSIWVGPFSFTTDILPCAALSPTMLPFVEDFESVDSTFVGATQNVFCGATHSWKFETDNAQGRLRIGTDANGASSGNGSATMDVDPSGPFVENYLILTLDLSNYAASTALELYFDLADFGDEQHAQDRVWIRGSAADSWVEVYDWSTGHNPNFLAVGAIDIDAALSGAGQTVSSSFQVRFGQYDNFPTASDGLGLDNILIKEKAPNDVAITAISAGTCTSTESVTVDITNAGTNTQTSIPVSLSIDGIVVATETWTGSLGEDSTVQYTFTATFDASVAGSYNIEGATQLATDTDANNDGSITTIVVEPTFSSPYGESFEGSTSVPQGWTADGLITGTGHNAPSNVLYDNLYSGDQSFTVTTPKIAVATGDFASFDYRYVDFSSPYPATTLGAGDTLFVQISTDCGATFTTVDMIDSSNHVVSTNMATKSYDLTPYAGQTVIFRMFATWGTGDYYLDLDNFFVGVPLAQSATATDALCAGGASGTATITATDGLAPYTYNWSNGQTSMMATGLSAGMAYYTVTDAAGTMMMDSVAVGEPAMAMSAMSSVDMMVSCNGATDASVSATAMNGTAPYSYAWTNGMMMDTLMNVGAGAYAVLVTDANGCTAFTSVVVTEPDAMSAMTMAADISCNGAADGTGDVMVSGGTGAYTYAWSNAATTASLTGLGAGTYTVTATDANNCMVMDSVTIAEPMAITAAAATDADVTCNGDTDGAVSVTASGGTGTLSYAWSNGSALATVTGIAAGTYDVTVTDANGCTVTSSATVAEPDALVLTMSSVPDSLRMGMGSATATVSGGTAPYTYAWDNGGTTATLTDLVEGLLTVVVTDTNGCTVSGFVDVADVVSTNLVDYVTDLSIYPNPARNNTVIDLELSQNADIAISVYTVTGVLVQDFGKENTSRVTETIDVSNYAEGLYLVRFVIDNQIVTKKLIVTK